MIHPGNRFPEVRFQPIAIADKVPRFDPVFKYQAVDGFPIHPGLTRRFLFFLAVGELFTFHQKKGFEKPQASRPASGNPIGIGWAIEGHHVTSCRLVAKKEAGVHADARN